MSWDYWNFPRHQVSAEKFKTRRRNTIISYYRYKVDRKLGKVVYAVLRNPYARVENCYYITKILEYYNDWVIIQFLDNKTPQVEFNNIHAFILAGISTNKAYLVKVNEYGDMFSNDEAANNFYIFFFKSVPYTLQ